MTNKTQDVEGDYVYSTSEDGSFADYCSVIDDLNDAHEVGEKVKIYRGVIKKYSHSDFITPLTIERLIEDMQESAWDEMGEHAEEYLHDINAEKINDLEKVITNWMENNSELTFFGVVDIEEIEVTVE